MLDITKTGPVGLRGLKGINQKTVSPEEAMKSLRGMGFGRTAAETNRIYRPQETQNRGLEFASMGVGDSTYDKDIQTLGEAQNINDFRGNNQSGLMQIINGTLKMGTTAITTALDGTIGTLMGIGQGIQNLTDDDPKTGFWQGMWDNDFNKAMASIQDEMETALPNYYTDAQQNSPWYSSTNLLSANFLGDKLLKNAGFTIGALATTLLPVGGIGKAIGVVGKLIGGAKTINAFNRVGKFADRLARTFISANSEASIEAINAVNSQMKAVDANLEQRRQEAMSVADDNYRQAIASGANPDEAMRAYIAETNNINSSLELARKQAESDARDVGNSVYGLNVALLSLTNNLEFSKFMKGGYNTQKGIKDMTLLVDGKHTDNLADWAKGILTGKSTVGTQAKNITAGRIVAGTASRFMEEGFEEGAQDIISDSNQMQAQAKLNQWANQKYRTNKDKYSLFASAINPEATSDLVDYMKAVNKAWDTDFGTFESPGWQDVFLGGLTGMLGTVGIRPNKQGKLSIGWQGGAYEEYRELSDAYAENEAKIQEVNERITKPEFVKNTRHAVAAMTLTNDMNEALQNNNIKMFKNAELMSVLNDALFFKDNGLLDSYKEFYKQAATNITDEDINEVRSQMRDMETGKSYFDGKTDEDLKALMRDKATSTLEKINRTLANYEEQSLLYKEEFAKLNPLLAEDAVRELTAKRTLYDDLQRRRDELQKKAESVPEATKAVTGNNYGEQIDEIDKQMGKIADELKDYNKHPEKLIKELTRKYEIYQKAQIGKDSKKTIERYQKATTLQEVADTFYFNDKNEDTFNEALKSAEGDNKALLESFKPFMAELNSAKDAIIGEATKVTSDPNVQQQFIDTFGRYVDRALGDLVENPNAAYNKSSLASAIRAIGDAIEDSTKTSEDPEQVLAGSQQNTILHSIADYLESVSTVQNASKAPQNNENFETQDANEALKTDTEVKDNADEALKDSNEIIQGNKEEVTDFELNNPEAEDKKPTEVKESNESKEGAENKETPTPAASSTPSGGENSEEKEETPEKKPTNEELKSVEESKKPQQEEKKAEESHNIDKSAKIEKPTTEEGNPSTSEATKEEKKDKPKQPAEKVTENTNKTKDEEAPMPKKSFRGNAFLQYSQSINSEDQKKAGVAEERTAKSAIEFFKFLKSEGIDVHYITNNFIGRLLDAKDDKKLTVQYMSIKDKSGNLRNDVFLVIPYTDKVARICPQSDTRIAGNIKDTNLGKYLIVGVLGFSSSEEGLKAGHKFILDNLNAKRAESGYNSQYFVDNELSNKIYDVSPGSIIRRYATEDTEHPNRDLKDLLADERTNPHGLTIDNIRWAVLEGLNEQVEDADIKYINFDGTERALSILNAVHPGKVYMFIPGADGVLIPQYVETLAYNDSIVNHNSQYWKDIQSKINAIFSAKDTEARMIAMNELRKDLLFSRGNNLYYQSSPAETDFDTIKYRKGNLKNDVVIDFKAQNYNAEEAKKQFIGMIEDINPRLNIQTTVLGSKGGAKYYMDAGLLQVNIRLLGTVNAQSYLYPIDTEGKAIETFRADKSGNNNSRGGASSSETVVYINNDKYYYNNDVYYDTFHHEITDAVQLKQIRDIQAIQSGKAVTVELGPQKTKYWEIDGTVYTNYKQGGYFPLNEERTKEYYKAKKRQQDYEEQRRLQREEDAEAKRRKAEHTPPKYKVDDVFVVYHDGKHPDLTYKVVLRDSTDPDSYYTVDEDGLKYWVEGSAGITIVTEQELEKLAVKPVESEGLTEEQFIEDNPTVKKAEENQIKGKSVVNGETLEGRMSAKDLEDKANLANFDNAFRKLPKDKKTKLKDAITKASGKPMKGLKDVKAALESSTKEAHALYLSAKTEQDIDNLIDKIESCGI